jgi:signal transduction histidine kinase
MQERVRQVGGRLTVRLELNRGTEILAEVLLSAAVNKEQATTYAEEGLES